MSLYFNPTEFSQRYGIFCFPILADLTVYSLFSRATTAAKAQIASLVAGAGIAYLLVDRTSLFTGLIGAGLYLAYKVALYFYATSAPSGAATPIVDLVQATRALEQSYDTLQKEFVVTYNHAIDFVSSIASDRALRSLIHKNEVAFSIQHAQKTRSQRKNQIDDQILSILTQCRTILFQIYQQVEETEQKMQPSATSRFSRIIALLKDPQFNPNHTFGKALLILLRSYRLFHRSGYILNLTLMRKRYMILTDYETILMNERQREIQTVFQETQNKFQSLIGAIYCDIPENTDIKLFQDAYAGAPPYFIPDLPLRDAAQQLGL